MLYKKKNDHLHSSFEDFQDNVVVFLKSERVSRQDFKESNVQLSIRLCKVKHDFNFRYIFDRPKKDENNPNASIGMRLCLFSEKNDRQEKTCNL